MELVAGIDAGTQSLKVVVYDPATRGLVATASMPLELISGEDGRREQRPAHQSSPAATARRTARANCRPVCVNRCGSLAAGPCTFTVIAILRTAPPAASTRPLAVGTNSSGPRSPTR